MNDNHFDLISPHAWRVTAYRSITHTVECHIVPGIDPASLNALTAGTDRKILRIEPIEPDPRLAKAVALLERLCPPDAEQECDECGGDQDECLGSCVLRDVREFIASVRYPAGA